MHETWRFKILKCHAANNKEQNLVRNPEIDFYGSVKTSQRPGFLTNITYICENVTFVSLLTILDTFLSLLRTQRLYYVGMLPKVLFIILY